MRTGGKLDGATDAPYIVNFSVKALPSATRRSRGTCRSCDAKAARDRCRVQGFKRGSKAQADRLTPRAAAWAVLRKQPDAVATAFQRFAKRLLADCDAVRAAMTLG